MIGWFYFYNIQALLLSVLVKVQDQHEDKNILKTVEVIDNNFFFFIKLMRYFLINYFQSLGSFYSANSDYIRKVLRRVQNELLICCRANPIFQQLLLLVQQQIVNREAMEELF